MYTKLAPKSIIMNHSKVLNIDCAEDSDGDSDSAENETDKTKKAPPYGRGLITLCD